MIWFDAIVASKLQTCDYKFIVLRRHLVIFGSLVVDGLIIFLLKGWRDIKKKHFSPSIVKVQYFFN